MGDIHHINLAGLDLNLLVVFDALMSECHVTRAGERLGLSQPATSNALARLRHLTGDGLFVRTAAGLRPTPRAHALHRQLRPALQGIQAALLEEATFEPATSDRIFAIGLSDYGEFTLLPVLMQRLQTLAPAVGVQVRTGDRQTLLSLLDDGAIDLACGVFPETVAWHRQQPLFEETFVSVCRQNHPSVGDVLTLDEYLRLSHLLISIQEDRVGRVDRLLAEQNLQRHVALSMPHFLAVPAILGQTDLVATLAQRVALAFNQPPTLKLLPLPLPLGGFTMVMRWHQSTENTPSCQWLRSVVAAVSQEI